MMQLIQKLLAWWFGTEKLPARVDPPIEFPLIIRIVDELVLWGPSGNTNMRVAHLSEDGLSLYKAASSGDLAFLLGCFWGNRSEKFTMTVLKVLVFTRSELDAIGTLTPSAATPDYPPNYSAAHLELSGHGEAGATALVDVVTRDPARRILDVPRVDVYVAMAETAIADTSSHGKRFRKYVKLRLRAIKDSDPALYSEVVARVPGTAALLGG